MEYINILIKEIQSIYTCRDELLSQKGVSKCNISSQRKKRRVNVMI
jgi:hypothetical protein